MTSDNGQAVNALLEHVRTIYSDRSQQQLALERYMQNNEDAREAIALYLLERGPDVVRVPLKGTVS